MRRKDAVSLRAVTPTPAEYTATRPLEVVQIDHTQVDVIVVDEQSREPIGHPRITLAVDVLTRWWLVSTLGWGPRLVCPSGYAYSTRFTRVFLTFSDAARPTSTANRWRPS